MMIVQTQKLRALLQFEVVARKNKRMIGFHIPWVGGPDFKLAEGRA